MAKNRCMREAIWLRQLMDDVSRVQEKTTTITCDNQGFMALAMYRSKGINVQYHFIRK